MFNSLPNIAYVLQNLLEAGAAFAKFSMDLCLLSGFAHHVWNRDEAQKCALVVFYIKKSRFTLRRIHLYVHIYARIIIIIIYTYINRTGKGTQFYIMLEVVGGSKNIYIYNGRHRIFSSSLWSLMICKFVKTLSFISPILQIQRATSPAPLIHPQLPVDVLRISPSFGASSAVHTARQAPLATAAASLAVSVEAKPQALEVLAMQCGQSAPWATPGGVLRPMSSGKPPLGPKLEVEFHDMSWAFLPFRVAF